MSNTPLTIKAVKSKVTVSLQRYGSPCHLNLTVKKNGIALSGDFRYGFSETNPFYKSITLQKGETLTIFNNSNKFSIGQVDLYKFIIQSADLAEVYGNVNSLIGYSYAITSPHQFYKLFKDCENVDFNVELPATTLRQSCYEKMFEGCLNLTTAPQLPASKLANKCYKEMFRGCIKLQKVPKLPAKELIFKCYAGMFEGCELIKTVEIMAQKLATKACSYMFYGCSKIRQVKAHFKQWVATATQNWLSTTCTGAFYKFNSLDEEYGTNRIPRNFRVVDLNKEPITFTATKDYSSITLVQAGKPNLIDLYYCINDQKWFKYIPGKKLILREEDIVQFKNNSPFFSIDEKNFYQFVMTGKIKISGKVESLTNFRSVSCGCFIFLFKDCVVLENAPLQLYSSELAARCYEGMFMGCTSIKTAPNLPATKLAIKCYKDMFEGCTALKAVPTLPALKIDSNCYEGMFRGCTKLTSIPNDLLPSLYLRPECYQEMFMNCTNLQIAPQLPATYLSNGCYTAMFKNCQKLVTPPSLPATDLTDNCYMLMFWNCTSLTTPPVLPAKFLKINCYCGMFRNCVNLTRAPQLPAKNLVLGCYENMFENCHLINDVWAGFEHWKDHENNTHRWLEGVAKNGTFHHSDLLNTGVERNGTHIPVGWNFKHLTYYTNPLTFTSIEESTTNLAKIALSKIGDPDPICLRYKIDNDCWKDYEIGKPIVLQKGQKISFINDTESFSKDSKNFYYFSINDGKIVATGEVNSLIRTDEFKPYIFANLFKDCSGLTEPPVLTNTVLADYCYYQMFYNCVNLKWIPRLAANILAKGCYLRMFYNCTSLTKVKICDFKQTLLKENCCKEMFGSCTSLVKANIPYKYLAPGCFENMFANCSKLKTLEVGFEYWYDKATINWLQNVPAYGTFIKPVTLKTSVGTSRIPESWTTAVNGETTTPLTFVMNDVTTIRVTKFGSPKYQLDKLFYKINNATWTPYVIDQEITLGKDDYIQFRNYQSQFSTDRNNYYHFEFKSDFTIRACGNIMSLVNFAKDIENDYQFAYLFSNCQNLVTAPILPAMNLKDCCYYNMFAGCTHLAKAPQLPATTIAKKAYLQMFANCIALQNIPVLPATDLTHSRCCYRGMFRNCWSLRQVELLATAIDDGCFANMFNGCKNLYSVTVHFTNWGESTENPPTTDWLKGVAPNGTFNKPEELPEIFDNSHIPWQSNP